LVQASITSGAMASKPQKFDEYSSVEEEKLDKENLLMSPLLIDPVPHPGFYLTQILC
jgi:hypothetical protein